MTDNGKIMNLMERVFTRKKIISFIKDSSKMENTMGKEFSSIRMGINMKDNF
jgi:hypothetical protein